MTNLRQKILPKPFHDDQRRRTGPNHATVSFNGLTNEPFMKLSPMDKHRHQAHFLIEY